MFRLAVLSLSAVLLAAAAHYAVQLPASSAGVRDTVQAGDPALDATHLHLFSLVRNLTLTRGYTVRPFGTQSEQLAAGTLDGREVLLDVLRFDTPNATTVDSSWIEARTLRPIRMRSSNASRVVSLDFEGQRVRGGTTPTAGAPTSLDQQLGVRPFEWNMFGLALSALPLGPGYRATMPVYMDRFGRVVWYAVEVVKDTSSCARTGIARRCGRSSPFPTPGRPPPASGSRATTGSWTRRSSGSRACRSCTSGTWAVDSEDA